MLGTKAWSIWRNTIECLKNSLGRMDPLPPQNLADSYAQYRMLWEHIKGSFLKGIPTPEHMLTNVMDCADVEMTVGAGGSQPARVIAQTSTQWPTPAEAKEAGAPKPSAGGSEPASTKGERFGVHGHVSQVD